MGGRYCWVHAWNCHGNAEISWHFIQCVGSKDSCTHGPLSFWIFLPHEGRGCVFLQDSSQAELWPSVRPRCAGSRVLCCSCQLKSCCISFMSNHLAENRGGGSQTLLVCPFVSVLKELNTPNIQSLHMEKVVLVLVLQTVTSSCAEQGCS